MEPDRSKPRIDADESCDSNASGNSTSFWLAFNLRFDDSLCALRLI